MDTKREEEEIEKESDEGNWLMRGLAALGPSEMTELEVAHRTISQLERALSTEHDNADMLYVLGNSYLAVGRTDDAIEMFCRVLFLEPFRHEARASLGAAYIAMQKGVAPIAPEPDGPGTDDAVDRHYLAVFLRSCFEMY